MNFFTRRKFLKTSILGGAFAGTIPSFLEKTVYALDSAAVAASSQVATGRDHPILVVLQLAGGNDGLNTVVPFASEAYQKARPRLALSKEEVLALSDTLGLHSSLTGLRSLYDDGDLSIIQGVGYPNPNRSHFRSTDIWQTASDSDEVRSDGWLGSYFDAQCAGSDPPAGVAIAAREPLAFAGDSPNTLTFQKPDSLQFRTKGSSESEALEDAYLEMIGSNDSGGSIGEISGTPTEGDPTDFLKRVALDAHVSSEQIREIATRYNPTVEFPGTKLGRSLRVIAGLIAGGFPSRVYYLTQGGYDTHTGQAGAHTRLLGELDKAVNAFVKELKEQKNFERVSLLTFSEFGRRVAENANAGTDHGAAAPMFLLGGRTNPGLHGKHPSLEVLKRGDLIHTTDFRSVYASVLSQWLDAPAEEILRASYPTLPLFRGA